MLYCISGISEIRNNTKDMNRHEKILATRMLKKIYSYTSTFPSPHQNNNKISTNFREPQPTHSTIRPHIATKKYRSSAHRLDIPATSNPSRIYNNQPHKETAHNAVSSTTGVATSIHSSHRITRRRRQFDERDQTVSFANKNHAELN